MIVPGRETVEVESQQRSLVVSTMSSAQETPMRMGSASYSYYYVYQAFAPLLRRWGNVVECARSEPTLDAGSASLHLGFLPLDFFRRAAHVPNVAFPFWDFPDLPDLQLDGPQSNWTRVANDLDLILTSSGFTREVFTRAGVRTPIRIVPVPVRPEYFAVPLWKPQQSVTIDCRWHDVQAQPRRDYSPPRGSAANAKAFYQNRVQHHLPRRAVEALRSVAHGARTVQHELRDMYAGARPSTGTLELSGVVYTTILNPFDQRKNWTDLLTGYLLALKDHDDATLVMKLVVAPDRATAGVNRVLRFYRQLGIEHRCRLVLISGYLSDEQMIELARASTYYLNSSKAEGACLPLQNFLAAARPVIAPRHTAIADVFHGDSGFVVESHPEPASWPQDAQGRCTTEWYRLVWTSLRDCIRESYDVAKNSLPVYEKLAGNARSRMAALAGAEPVWAELKAALDSIAPAGSNDAV